MRRVVDALEAARPSPSFGLVVRDAVLVAVGSIGLGLLVNAVRADGIPWVAHEEYEILVPCPETTGAVDRLLPGDPALLSESTLLVDARSRAAFDAWHLPRASSVVFDFLEPVNAEKLRRIAASGARRVVVYGDGNDPDSGEQLARELAGRGVKNVGFVAGGTPALRAILPGVTP